MAKKIAKTLMLNEKRLPDKKALKQLGLLMKVVPGLTDLHATVRWLCSEEVPAIIEKYKKLTEALKST